MFALQKEALQLVSSDFDTNCQIRKYRNTALNLRKRRVTHFGECRHKTTLANSTIRFLESEVERGEILHHFFTNSRAVPLVCYRVGKGADFPQTLRRFIMMIPRLWTSHPHSSFVASLSLSFKYRSSDVEDIIQVQETVARIRIST